MAAKCQSEAGLCAAIDPGCRIRRLQSFGNRGRRDDPGRGGPRQGTAANFGSSRHSRNRGYIGGHCGCVALRRKLLGTYRFAPFSAARHPCCSGRLAAPLNGRQTTENMRRVNHPLAEDGKVLRTGARRFGVATSACSAARNSITEDGERDRSDPDGETCETGALHARLAEARAAQATVAAAKRNRTVLRRVSRRGGGSL